MEPDIRGLIKFSKIIYFNPRAPCGARLIFSSTTGIRFAFQSTGSVWSPTRPQHSHAHYLKISIHGLRVEPDIQMIKNLGANFNFNPRAPCGARRATKLSVTLAGGISIHGLRVEPDRRNYGKSDRRRHFNPRAPCGARPKEICKSPSERLFQSTGSVWSPTFESPLKPFGFQFQSTGSVWSPTRGHRLI